ncbi:hypothetical protein KP509_11G081000 [Ceratopteris richardii]|uniref:Uncharacterized protein n=1 Tax=Ceratopteris richardii TaxID=49495 RepID=A0A8T2TX53_CERRI|nr:hypothetical protein KP509_11G081000 [Ceratopteris richardii]
MTSASARPPALLRNQSVSHGDRQQVLQSVVSNVEHKRRSRSFSSDAEFHDDKFPPPPTHPSRLHGSSGPGHFIQGDGDPSLRTEVKPESACGDGDEEGVDDALRELFRGKSKSKGGASFGGLLTGLFSCWNPRKSSAVDGAPISASKRVAALMEISKKQQFELANKQDTIDMLEWQLEQLHTMEKQMEADGSTAFFQEADENHEDEENRKPADPNIVGRQESKRSGNGQVPKKKMPSRKKDEHMNAGNGGDEAAAPTTDGRLDTLSLFEMATVRARFSVRSLGKALIKQLEASGYSVLKALRELEPQVAFARKEHVVYALESRINRAFYQGFESESFDGAGLTQILDPVSRCSTRLKEFHRLKGVSVADAVNSSHPCFDADFRRFCERKTRELWAQFSWSVSFRRADERDAFTNAFLDAAKAVWLLHRLAFSVHPHVSILRVGKGAAIDATYVEALPLEVPDSKPSCPSCSQTKVDFLVVPGFNAMDKVIRCQVYQHIHC